MRCIGWDQIIPDNSEICPIEGCNTFVDPQAPVIIGTAIISAYVREESQNRPPGSVYIFGVKTIQDLLTELYGNTYALSIALFEQAATWINDTFQYLQVRAIYTRRGFLIEINPVS